MRYRDIDLRAKLLSDIQTSIYVDSRAVRLNEKRTGESPAGYVFVDGSDQMPPREPDVCPVTGVLQRLGFLPGPSTT